MPIDDLLTVRQVADKYHAFTEDSLRWMIFNAERNGLSSALIRLGRRVYFDPGSLDRWLESRRCGSATGSEG